MPADDLREKRTEFRVSMDKALDRLLERNAWVWIKVPILLVSAWTFFLPSLWKIGLLLVASILCVFVSPCPVGPNVTGFHLGFMLVSHGGMVCLVFWYIAFALAYLQNRGVGSKLIGVGGLILTPLFVLAGALAIGLFGEFLGVPQQQVWTFLARWTPVWAQ